MSTVFESGVPKILGIGDPDILEVNFYYSTFSEIEWSDKRFKMNESIKTAKRTWYHKEGRHSTFNILINLFKYDTNPAGIVGIQNAKSTLINLFRYEHKDVKFCPFGTTPLKNVNSMDITVHVQNIEPAFLEEGTCLYDQCIVTLVTNELYDLSRLIVQ
ncbi:MAG: hypothetical protein HYS25_13840 [Ignavibacteriales bacterium]|nr:hypothetical protein [Ignavibacteriales bacterium]